MNRFLVASRIFHSISSIEIWLQFKQVSAHNRDKYSDPI